MDKGKQVFMAAQEEDSHLYHLKNLPPGVRFVPEDVELLYYLNLKILSKPMPIPAIMDVELYKHHPRDLCKSIIMYGKNEWYFFTTRAMNGGRSSQTAANGYWRASKRVKSVQNNGQEVGWKKVLVYHKDRSGEKKTNWIMHEFRMKDVATSSINPIPNDKIVCKNIHILLLSNEYWLDQNMFSLQSGPTMMNYPLGE